jgi:hypothetical protein
MRDGRVDDWLMNGCQFKNLSGFVVSHSGMILCGGKLPTAQHNEVDFPTTVNNNDDDE